MPTAPPAGIVTRGLMLVATIGVLCGLWTLNSNKLGSFYDYGSIVDAAAKFSAGLHPFRDFTSPLQTFTFWIAYGCEWLFGPSYFALAYGNLVLSLLLFGVIVYHAQHRFSLYGALLVGVALPAASTLQHGIIYYNSIALVLLSVIALRCAALVCRDNVRSFDAAVVLAVVVLCGITKINFYGIAIAVVAAFTLAFCLTRHDDVQWTRIATWAVFFIIIASALPSFEAIANGAKVSDWVQQVILTPGGRARNLADILRPSFYFRVWNDHYPGTILQGGIALCLAVYGFIACVALDEFRNDQHRNLCTLLARLGILGVFWTSTCLLIVSNVEIESLAMSFFLVGVVAMGTSGLFSGRRFDRVLGVSAIGLAVYFLVAGSVSLVRHSRINYEPSPFSRDGVAPDGALAYLRGVALSEKAAARLAAIGELVRENPGLKVYWGPGLALMNRIHGGVTDPAFPLWYHLGVSVHESDAPRLIKAIERSGTGLVVADLHWAENFPEAVRGYLDRSWMRMERGGVVIAWRKRGSE